ncbi:MAG: SMC-Scp complex subunit ScpB [Saprospiraceae bacterium]|nr:SMC-Scp complex subunit ScpB [Saprospiraceae bacterium]
MDKLSHHIEALVFVAENALSFKDLKNCLDEQFATKFKKEVVEDAITQLIEKYQSEDFAVEMVEISNGYRFMTKGAYYPTVATFLKQSTKKKLSKAALETLSIIAYKQPVEKSELEKIRGVSCDYSIQKLLDKELVEIIGRSEGPGRPLLYSTSEKFMDYFGLKSIQDLPKTRDIASAQSTIGDESILEVESVLVDNASSEEE